MLLHHYIGYLSAKTGKARAAIEDIGKINQLKIK